MTKRTNQSERGDERQQDARRTWTEWTDLRSAWRAHHGSGCDDDGLHGRALPLWRERVRSHRLHVAVAGLCTIGLVGAFAFGDNGPLYAVASLASTAVTDASTMMDGASQASADAAQNSAQVQGQNQTQAKSAVPSTPTPTPTQTMIKGLAGLDGAAQISTSGFVLGTDLQLQLEQELNIFASYGYSASVAMVDVKTGAALSTYGDAVRYSASAIKGPYVLSLAATGAIDLDAIYQGADDASYLTRQLIEQTITVSDNDAYTTLYQTYQSSPLVQWLEGLGVATDVTAGQYLDLSARDLARMWAQGYGYLFDSAGSTAGDPGSAEARTWLASEYTDTLNSSIHMALGESYSVYTKAGWINGEGDLYALNDAGIVRSSSGDYVLAVLTDACGEYGLLTELITLFDQIHSSVMGA